MMKIRIPKKHVAAGLAAILIANALQLNAVIAETVTETDTDAMTAVSAPAETEESETESENLSTVTIVHTAEITEEEYKPTDWWKADLGEYTDSFSLVSYEAVTNAVALDENGNPIEGSEASEDAVMIAQGQSGNTLISAGQADSAVSSVQDGYFAFTTYGYGHGVGMSQNGANFYAKYAGWNYQDILFHYYPGTALMNTGTAETETVTVQGVPGNVLMQVAEIVNREVGSSMHVEAIKAQAVAVYSYIKYYNNDSHDLKGKPNPSQKIIDACASVLGEALYYNGNFAMAMFYASSGGITANCNEVFTADIPYLRSVASEYDAAYDPHYGDVIYYSVEELRRKLQGAYGITLSANPENWITIVEGNGGYVNKVIIDGQITVRGNSFRAVMDFKSPKFTYICSASNDASAEFSEPIKETVSTAAPQPEQAIVETTRIETTPVAVETEAVATENPETTAVEIVTEQAVATSTETETVTAAETITEE